MLHANLRDSGEWKASAHGIALRILDGNDFFIESGIKMKTNRVECLCQTCGAMFLEIERKAAKRKFCSLSCRRHTQQTKDKIRHQQVGRKQSPETIQKRAAKQFGRKQSAETIEKRISKIRGTKMSVESRQKMSVRRLSNPNVRGEFHYKWNPDRKEQLRKTKLARLCYGLVGRAMVRGHKKDSRTQEQLGYSHEELRAHLEKLFKPGMTWENHGKGPGTWNVDHIRPIVSFPIGTHSREINALSNLQPLWADENLSKGSKF